MNQKKDEKEQKRKNIKKPDIITFWLSSVEMTTHL